MTALKKEKILITGGSGLLGLNWGYQVKKKYEVYLALHSRIIDVPWAITKVLPLDSVTGIKAFIEKVEPSCVVHTAGLTSIEICESQPELARMVNTKFAINVAAACSDMQVPLVHISTDNLFDGLSAMVDEAQNINPVNIYGITKADAERGIQDTHANSIIVRTNFYGWGPPYKPSFSDTIITSLRAGNTVSLFEDVYYTPILIAELVVATHELLAREVNGVFNICADQRVSKHDFGIMLAEIFDLDAGLVLKNRLAELRHLVSRPYDMSMSNKKICKILGRQIGNITEHLEKLLQQESLIKVEEIESFDSVR
jgi:dTDP-4-dehydrorhamnose reductase